MPGPTCFCPYVGLQPFSEVERDYFFGREDDARIISSNLYAAPLTVLYGASGVGKSSILQAAVLPHLRATSRTAALVFRDWQSPTFLDALKAKCVKAVEFAQGKPLEIDSNLRLDDLLAAAANAFRGTILVLFDQFEEYFLYHGESEHNPFDAEFARAVNREEVDANFLIALREDGLSKLDRFQARIPNLLTNRLRLDHLDAREAEKAIRGPLEVFNRNFRSGDSPIYPQGELVTAVLSEVRAGQLSLSETSGLGQTHASGNNTRIETPFLQLVMMRLWKEEMGLGSTVLRLETLERLGGAAQIVKTHLDEEMDKLSAEERRICASMFRFLVTPKGAKIAHATDDLISFAEGGADQVKPVLKKLADGRVFRIISPPERYEIFHDVLAPAILDWRSRYVQAQERVEAERRAQDLARAAKQRRRRRLVVGLSLVSAVVGAAVLFGWNQSRRANIDFSRKLASQALGLAEERLDLALLLSSEANLISGLPEVRASLFGALNSSANLTSFLQYGHTEAVRSVAFSGDGKILASGSLDKTIVLWNAESGFPIGPPLQGHTDWVSSVAFSPDSKKLASGSADKTVILWDISSGQREVLPETNADIVSCVAFSPDGKKLAWSDLDGSIVLWDVEKRQRIDKFLHGHKGEVYSVAFGGPEGKTLASSGADKKVMLWDVATRQPLATLMGHTNEVYSVAFSPDGKILASGGRDKSVILWDVPARKQRGTPLLGHVDRIFGLAFSADGKILASGSTDSDIILWDVESGKRRDQSALSGHMDGVYSVAFVPKPGETTLASGSDDGTVTVWDIPARKWLGRPLTVESPGRTQVRSVAFTRDNSILASGGQDLVLWDVATGQTRAAPLPMPSASIVTSVAFSPDDKTLASGSMDNSISFWDASTMKPLRSPLTGHTDWVSAVAFSPDGRTLASASADKKTVLWDVSTGQQQSLPLEHTDVVSSVVFSPDGKILASGSWDDTIILWDMEGHKILRSLKNGRDNPVYSLAFSPDGRTLASGNQHSISLWNVSTGQPLGSPLRKHRAPVRSVAFSFDGKLLASASDDKSIILWDAATGLPLGSALKEPNAPVYSVAFSRDGKLLASGGSMDATQANWPLILWDLDYESWKSRACDVVNRNLSEYERQQYFRDQPYRIACAIGVVREADAHALRKEDEKAATGFGLAVDLGRHSLDPEINNRICWYGSLDGFASVVKPACDRSVALATPSFKGFYSDSRGVALAMTGRYPEAIQDFEQFVKWSEGKPDREEQKRRREGWIRELQAGRNPIDQATRRELRIE